MLRSATPLHQVIQNIRQYKNDLRKPLQDIFPDVLVELVIDYSCSLDSDEKTLDESLEHFIRAWLKEIISKRCKKPVITNLFECLRHMPNYLIQRRHEAERLYTTLGLWTLPLREIEKNCTFFLDLQPDLGWKRNVAFWFFRTGNLTIRRYRTLFGMSCEIEVYAAKESKSPAFHTCWHCVKVFPCKQPKQLVCSCFHEMACCLCVESQTTTLLYFCCQDHHEEYTAMDLDE